ncbi:cupin domain-containing protein [candidate division KSB1 bacterium]
MGAINSLYPDIIKNLPEANVPIDGVQAWLLQGEDSQLCFFILEEGVTVPLHSHGAQWGTVLNGELELTISGETIVYRDGDSYFIPDGAEHTAILRKRSFVIDYFADKDRYKPKA